ncbi:MAG: tRNA lysidine(34) synthetase TilS [Planctomycetes bacterium]|nr:tRNA lysidine(34) synthetase TilS [Planctomycetota bacterium]
MAAELPFPPPGRHPEPLGARWGDLARGAGLDPAAPALVALSGGADSVFLLHCAAQAPERPRLIAVHLDHGLRGAESDEDAQFCRELCARLDVPFVLRRLTLDPRPAGLEARAREARYDALVEEARKARIGTVLTGHHADDALETLLLRWARGSETAGLPGLRAQLVRGAENEGEVLVVRPLLQLRREELRTLLAERGVEWREDSSNASPRFARNRLRKGLLPRLSELGGPAALESLRGFARAVEEFEEHCASFTSGLAWQEPRHAAARATGAGRLPRAALRSLPSPLARRVLARLLAERTGSIPGRATLDRILAALSSERLLALALPGGWGLRASAEWLALDPPREPAAPEFERPLAPGSFVRLPCGRAIVCERSSASGEPPHEDWRAEISADALGLWPELHVRYPRPGDRFQALGAPGGKRLARFFQDQEIPAAERAQVPLVLHGERIVWVAGLRPAAAYAIGPTTLARLSLVLLHPEGAGGAPRHWRDGDFGAR